MTQLEIDKLTDELIDARASIVDLESKLFALRDDMLGVELDLVSAKADRDHYQYRSIMHLRRYYEVASALGFNPERDHVAHAVVLPRAKELAMFARVA